LGFGVFAQEGPNRNAIVLSFENDMFNRMDWYFSNGVNIAVYHSSLGRSPLNRILFPGRLQEGDIVYYGLKLRQEIYTPKDLNHEAILTGDHPYAATLSISSEKIVNRPSEGLRFTSGLQLGVLGPLALGFHAQDFIHRITPSELPQGWNNQVGNDLMLNFSLAVDKEIFSDEFSQFALHGRVRLGTVYTDASAGFRVRMEEMPKYFTRLEPDENRSFNIYFELGGDVRFVGYDASLQGGMLNRTSPYTIPSQDVRRVLGVIMASAVFELKRHQLLFYQNVVSPGFSKAGWHAWLGISYRYWW